MNNDEIKNVQPVLHKANVSRRFRIGNIFVKWNRAYKWLSIEHDWKGIVVEHSWYWGFERGIRYYKTWLPF